MKKILKNPLFSFILGSIIFGGIGTVFAYSILAEDVGYTPKDTTWEVDNVSDAIDDLRDIASNNYVYGTVTSSNYRNWVNVDLGFQPRMVVAVIPTSGGYLRSFVYIKGQSWTGYERGGSLGTSNENSVFALTDNGFKWVVYDSSWGSQTIKYYAFK